MRISRVYSLRKHLLQARSSPRREARCSCEAGVRAAGALLERARARVRARLRGEGRKVLLESVAL